MSLHCTPTPLLTRAGERLLLLDGVTGTETLRIRCGRKDWRPAELEQHAKRLLLPVHEPSAPERLTVVVEQADGARHCTCDLEPLTAREQERELLLVHASHQDQGWAQNPADMHAYYRDWIDQVLQACSDCDADPDSVSGLPTPLAAA